MRKIKSDEITEAVKNLCQECNLNLPKDVLLALEESKENETWALAKDTLDLLRENVDVASSCSLPVCQDTGMVSIYVELGQELHIVGDFMEAVQQGVARGYTEGYLRCSIVGDPLQRVNTGNNTPASVSIQLVQGDGLKLTLMPKGFGSENMSQLKMLKPADGVEGVVDFVVSTVKAAGSNACPPMVVGVGIGGNFEKVTYLSKKAMLREIGEKHKEPFYANLEEHLLEECNKLGIGPQGFGGRTTVLGLAIETGATHVAGLPVAVNIGCHVMRRASVLL